jgi:hypothetical protein
MLCPIAVRAEIDRCMEDEDVRPRTVETLSKAGFIVTEKRSLEIFEARCGAEQCSRRRA